MKRELKALHIIIHFYFKTPSTWKTETEDREFKISLGYDEIYSHKKTKPNKKLVMIELACTPCTGEAEAGEAP